MLDSSIWPRSSARLRWFRRLRIVSRSWMPSVRLLDDPTTATPHARPAPDGSRPIDGARRSQSSVKLIVVDRELCRRAGAEAPRHRPPRGPAPRPPRRFLRSPAVAVAASLALAVPDNQGRAPDLNESARQHPLSCSRTIPEPRRTHGSPPAPWPGRSAPARRARPRLDRLEHLAERPAVDVR